MPRTMQTVAMGTTTIAQTLSSTTRPSTTTTSTTTMQNNETPNAQSVSATQATLPSATISIDARDCKDGDSSRKNCTGAPLLPEGTPTTQRAMLRPGGPTDEASAEESTREKGISAMLIGIIIVCIIITFIVVVAMYRVCKKFRQERVDLDSYFIQTQQAALSHAMREQVRYL